MLVTGSTVALLVAIWTADGVEAAREFRFGEHVIVVQPGPTAVRLASATTATTADVQQARAEEVVPPMPMPPAPTPRVPGPTDVEGIAPAAAAPVPTVVCDPSLELANRYREVYNALPYNRTEYLANASYRHEAAMEMLFGQMRPTVIHRSHTSVDVNLPEIQVSPLPYSRYGFNSGYYPFWSPGYRVHRSW